MLCYPFAAIVGQTQMKMALLLSAVSREVAGVLLCGEKGTGKSTAARALANLLPKTKDNCKNPFMNLPLNATEEALLGSIDLERTIRKGKPVYSPGLLVKADQGVVYIDELNLLPGHLTACLLDASESGMIVIEREGLSLTFKTNFIMIGSMNPEEGEVSPQLLDRFGLCVMVKGEEDPAARVEIIKRRLAFERDPLAFVRLYQEEEKILKTKLLMARSLYHDVWIPARLRVLITNLCLKFGVAGHRADIVLQAAARAKAALSGRKEVTVKDIEAVAELVLVHRRRQRQPKAKRHEDKPPQEKRSFNHNHTKTQKLKKTSFKKPTTPKPPNKKERNKKDETKRTPLVPPQERGIEPREGQDKVFDIGQIFPVHPIEFLSKRNTWKGLSGKRIKTLGQRGRFVRAIIPRGKVRDLALLATIRAAAPYQIRRGRISGQSLLITESDLREKQRKTKIGHLLLFCVDASGSMGAEARMRETKGAIMSLLLSAYQKRDRVALIIFRGRDAKLVLPPTNSVELAGKILRDLPIGGSTPLPAALYLTASFLERTLRREPYLSIVSFFITDGRGNVSLGQKNPQEEIKELSIALATQFPQVEFVVIDTEIGLVRLEMAKELARTLSARYFTPEALKADRLTQIAINIFKK